MTLSRPPRSRALLCGVAAVSLVSCDLQRKPLGPAPYIPPPVGSKLQYVGFSNVVVSADGWKVRFADDQGRQGLRAGVFITGDSAEIASVDSTDLSHLWPLKTGNEVVMHTRRGRESIRWMFKVVGQALIDVPAGTFQTYVVQAVERPEKFTDPKTQTTLAFTWWFAPAINAVVRFETTYVSGAEKGRVVASTLKTIETKNATASDARP
jgi:hypothetical protein